METSLHAYLLTCLLSYCTDKTTLTGARRPTDAQLAEVSGSASGSDFSLPSTASEGLESLTPGTSSCTHPTSCLLMLVNMSEYIHSFMSDKIHYNYKLQNETTRNKKMKPHRPTTV